ncbi:hypothetical protein N7532_003519 [Penicillium argentinense]|uniref:Uncharacterized protein n=1 Tax=Penicillium argentinense TaxID=1131581 RepID=A0A9W9KDZ1_9EURO|nr:uncharacterized protein N7532_003519 [Penicillium argentinense]KAJ5102990.1 hypothetical protein N7532_003519 [Penicillium argentinense]
MDSGKRLRYDTTICVQTSLVYFLLCIIAVAVYRLALHPLARHPGPLFARISAIPNWYHAKRGDRHEWLHKMHTQYGTIVRFTPNSISFNTPSALESIYKSRKANIIKSDWYQCVRDSAGGFESTFTARDKARHGVKRRLLSHAFSDKALREYEPRICQKISSWLDYLEAEAEAKNGTVDLGEWCNFLIFDILGDLAFGASFGFTAKEEDRSIVGLVPRATGGWYSVSTRSTDPTAQSPRLTSQLGYHPLTKWWRHILFKTPLGSLLGGRSYRDNARLRSFCLGKLKSRATSKKTATISGQENKGCDMFEHLLSGRDPETGESYSLGDLACENVLLMVAGSQSTAGALSAIFFYLAHHPGKLTRLRNEIHQAFDSENAIRYSADSKLSGLSYLRACIDEAMRLSPPTPGHLPREILEKEGSVIDGCWFPPQTKVGIAPYALHRNALYFSQPLSFHPERWTEEHEGREMQPSAFAPFSAGATGCVGQKLAMMELSLVVAQLLWRFDLSLALHGGDGPVEYRMRDCFIGAGEGPRLQLIQSHP